MQQESATTLRLKDQDHHRSTPPLAYHNSYHHSFPNHQHIQRHQNTHNHPSSVRSAHGSSSSLSSLGGSAVNQSAARGPSPSHGQQDSTGSRSSTPNLVSPSGSQGSPTGGQGSTGGRPAARWIPPSQAQQKIESHNNAIFRRTRGILNKLTPDKFDKLTSELLAMIGRDSDDVLKGVILLIFDKALDEPKYSSMYAQLCRKLDRHLNNDKFCILLLRKSQSEFENRRQASEFYEGRDLTPDQEEARNIAKQKMLGNIKFICELGKEKLLDEGILHECVHHLLKRKPTIRGLSEDLECLCQIMKTIGAQLDTEESSNLTEQYFRQMHKYEKDERLSQRIRFLLRDVIELRENKWIPVRRVQRENGPAPIQKIRDEAYFELGIPNPNYIATMNAAIVQEQLALAHLHLAGGVNPFASSPGLLPFPIAPGQHLFPNAGMSYHSTSNPLQLGMPQQAKTPTLPPSQTNVSQNKADLPSSGGGGRLGMAPTYAPSNNQGNPSPKRNISPTIPNQQQQNRMHSDHQQQGHNNAPSKNNVPQRYPSHGAPYDKSNAPPPHRDQPQQHQHRDFHEPGGRFDRGPPDHNRQFNNNSMDNNRGMASRQNQNLPPRMLRQLQQKEAAAAAQHGGHSGPPTQQHYQQQQQQHGPSSPAPPHQQQTQQHYGPGPHDRLGHAYQPAKNLNPLTNLTQASHALYGNSGEISLRPPENSIVSLSNPFPSSQASTASPLSQRRDVVTSDMPTSTSPKQSEPPRVTKPKKVDEREVFTSNFNAILSDTLTSDDCELLIDKIAGLSINDKYHADALLILLKRFIDQDQLASLLKRLNFSNESIKNAYKSLLNELQVLEATVPRAKSHLASLLGRLIEDGILSLSDAADPLSGGKHYPLFLLTLQQLDKSKGSDWLSQHFAASTISVMSMIPECDRRKEKVADILEDRGITYLQPLFRIEIELMKQFQLMESSDSKAASAKQAGGGDGPANGESDSTTDGTASPTLTSQSTSVTGPPAAGPLWKWMKESVPSSVQKSWGFINILTTCLLKYAHKVASKGSSPPEATTILAKYDKVLLALVHDSVDLQLALLYALQTHVYSLAFPKGLLLKYFVWLYDAEIVDGETFLKWREDINDEYPGKGQALFQVNQYLQWLEQQDSDDDEDEE